MEPVSIKLTAKFFQDPDWQEVERMITDYIEPLKDFNTIDLKAPAEHVKAEVIGRMLAYNALSQFLNDTHLVGRTIEPLKNPFK